MESPEADAAIIVFTTMPDRETAQALARTLLTGRLAACVNLGASVESMYHWRGQIETAVEVPVAIKTQALFVFACRGRGPCRPSL